MQTERYFTFVGFRNDLPQHIESKSYPNAKIADEEYPPHAQTILNNYLLHEVRVYEIVAANKEPRNEFKILGIFNDESFDEK